MSEYIRTVEEWFNLINKHKEGIELAEDKVRMYLNDYILEFFADKGMTFEEVDNPWDPVDRYYLPNLPYPDFKPSHAPAYYVNPFDLTVTFQWWKESNLKRTKIIWDPREQTIKNLYDKKLKRVFKLI